MKILLRAHAFRQYGICYQASNGLRSIGVLAWLGSGETIV